MMKDEEYRASIPSWLQQKVFEDIEKQGGLMIEDEVGVFTLEIVKENQQEDAGRKAPSRTQSRRLRKKRNEEKWKKLGEEHQDV